MLLLFVSTLFFTWQVAQKSREIRDLRETLTLKESQRAENQTLANSIMALQEQLVVKVVRELNEFDNVYFEICNEPYERAGQTDEWQHRIAEAIADLFALHAARLNLGTAWCGLNTSEFSRPQEGQLDLFG